MSTAKDIRPGTLTRRDTLKASGLALGGAALGAASSQEAAAGVPGIYSGISPSEKNTFFSSLKPYYPGEETLEADEMRITFLGTSCIPRLVQACNSVFVELGNGDSFVFDCGTGVIVKYYAMKIGMEKIDRIFLTHLHADHMGDVAFVYGFGPSVNRRWPLYIWGPSRSGLEYPKSYADGTADFCYHLQEMMRWHNESQSFLPSGYVPDGKEPPYDLPDMTCLGEGGGTDAYDLMYKELDWRLNPGVAYDHNGVKIWHFPAVHCRAGSVCYKLEWNGLSMAFSGDNKPNRYMIDNASGVDVLIHEIVVPTDVWVEKGLGVPRDSPYWDKAYAGAKDVQDSSHTPQKAYGYLLDQMAVPPRLAIGTHFQASDDTIRAAMTDIRKWYSKGEVIIANDLMVINVTKRKITKRRAIVSSYTWQPPTIFRSRALATAKYPNSTFQLDPEGLAHCIPPAVIDQKG